MMTVKMHLDSLKGHDIAIKGVTYDVLHLSLLKRAFCLDAVAVMRDGFKPIVPELR